MLSVRGLFRDIHDNDASFRLFASIAAKGENQGGWENARIAALAPDPELAPKIARHGADEEKHGRIFLSMLRARGLEPVEVPRETDYCALLEEQGIGLSHERLRGSETLSDDDVVIYLAHSRVTEQRAAEDMRLLRDVFGDDPDIGRGISMICDDEQNHLAYCHEELLRLRAAGHGPRIASTLREIAHAEIRVNRDVSLAVTARMGAILGWPRVSRALIAAGIHATYGYERLVGRRRMVRLRPPERGDAMGPRRRDRIDHHDVPLT